MISAKIIDEPFKKYHDTQMVSVKNVVTGVIAVCAISR